MGYGQYMLKPNSPRAQFTRRRFNTQFLPRFNNLSSTSQGIIAQNRIDFNNQRLENVDQFVSNNPQFTGENVTNVLNNRISFWEQYT